MAIEQLPQPPHYGVDALQDFFDNQGQPQNGPDMSFFEADLQPKADEQIAVGENGQYILPGMPSPESTQSEAPQFNDRRLSVRVCDRIVRFAGTAADRAESFADNMAARRTPSEMANDNLESAKKTARLVGQTATATAAGAGYITAPKYDQVKTSSHAIASSFRGFIKERAAAARERAGQAIRSGVEAAQQRGKAAARVGREAVAKSGYTALGVGVTGVVKAAEGVDATGQAAARLTYRVHAKGAESLAAVHGRRAETAAIIANRAMLKDAYLMNKQFDAEKRAAELRVRGTNPNAYQPTHRKPKTYKPTHAA